MKTNESRENVFTALQWVHDMVRRDLQVCQDLAAAVAEGVPSNDVRARIQDLSSRGPLFQLRANCLRYCMFVRRHHYLEDAFFPAIREAAPELNSTVEKLESDHREVSSLLDMVEEASSSLTDEAGKPSARSRLIEALDELAAHLLTHLDYEEAVLGPLLSRWEQ